MKKLVFFLFMLSITLLQQTAHSFGIRNIINESGSTATILFCNDYQVEKKYELKDVKDEATPAFKKFPTYKKQKEWVDFKLILNGSETLPTYTRKRSKSLRS